MEFKNFIRLWISTNIKIIVVMIEHWDQWSELIVNDKRVYQGHFEQCVNNAKGYPKQNIVIKPILNRKQ